MPRARVKACSRYRAKESPPLRAVDPLCSTRRPSGLASDEGVTTKPSNRVPSPPLRGGEGQGEGVPSNAFRSYRDSLSPGSRTSTRFHPVQANRGSHLHMNQKTARTAFQLPVGQAESFSEAVHRSWSTPKGLPEHKAPEARHLLAPSPRPSPSQREGEGTHSVGTNSAFRAIPIGYSR